MSIFKKFLNGINPDEEEPFDDVFNDDEIYGGNEGSFGNNAGDISDFMQQSNGGYSPYGNQGQNPGSPPQAQQQPPYQPNPSPPAAGGGAITIAAGNSMQYSAEVKLVKPEDYANPNQIADHVINRRTVILNLEETNKETARRLLDYLNGVAYAIQGQVKKVSEKTFVIAPNNIMITEKQLKEETRRDSDSNEGIY
ncbi:MAG: cell division protein SepF [Oscillospiraceae bacterium]|nr:cell division protein SepF [Oscillospiraceae bacterium]